VQTGSRATQRRLLVDVCLSPCHSGALKEDRTRSAHSQQLTLAPHRTQILSMPCDLTRSLTYPPTHSLTRSLTHSLTRSHTAPGHPHARRLQLGLAVPEMGWNGVNVRKHSVVLEPGTKQRYYFVHSFIAVSAVCCLLSVVCCLLFVVCCLLFVVCCLLSVVCCLLSVVYCW
jgi:hypothetical protein